MWTGPTFSFDHNWADPIVERLSWLTDILTRRDASEQRRQVRLFPRRQLEYAVLPITPLERARLDNFLRRYQHEAVLLPIWTDAQELASSAASGQPEVSVNTVTYDFDAGQYLILWRDYTNFEAIEIDSLTSGTVTLAENLVSTWPAGTVVLPARLARFSPTLKGTHIGEDVRPYRLQFDVDEGAASSNRITALSPDTYRSIDIMPPDVTDTTEQQEFSYEHPLAVIDNQIGPVRQDSGAQSLPNTMIGFQKLFVNRAEVSNWLGFLERRQGQRVPVYLTLRELDFQDVVINTAGIDDLCTYTSNGFAELYNEQDLTTVLCWTAMRSSGGISAGQQYFNLISAVEDNGDGTETITFENSISSDVETNPSLFRLSFARFCRLAADVAEFTWLTTCVVQTKGSFKELRDAA